MRLGYACISVSVQNCSTAKTVPLRSLERLENQEARFGHLEHVARRNLENTLRLLWHNRAHGIRFYRFSSQLVPLATHPVADNWNWADSLKDSLIKVGDAVRQTGCRVGTHPGQHTVVNAKDPRVFEIARDDLDYHDRLLSGMGLDDSARMVVHVGGGYGNPVEGLQRFVRNFAGLSPGVRRRLAVENDDRIYAPGDVLSLCREIGVPMVFDFHHFRCVNQGERLLDLLPEVFATWKGHIPKVHFSSPRSGGEFRSHADFIDPEEFRAFLREVAPIGVDFDVMLEAKQKDRALMRLREDLGLGECDPGKEWMDRFGH